MNMATLIKKLIIYLKNPKFVIFCEKNSLRLKVIELPTFLN